MDESFANLHERATCAGIVGDLLSSRMLRIISYEASLNLYFITLATS